MKRIILLICICLIFASCPVEDRVDKSDKEPPYKAKIEWDSKLYVNYSQSLIVDGDSVYFYERPPEYPEVSIYLPLVCALTKLNAETGKLIWRSNVYFIDIVFCQPIIIDGFVYVFLEPNTILCFDQETGEHTTTVKVDIDGKNLTLDKNTAFYQPYLYLSLWDFTSEYFTRLDVNEINHNQGPEKDQYPVLEIIWEPETKNNVTAKPVVHNNVIYTSTYTTTYGARYDPVELAGFDVDTKKKVFHVEFGGLLDGEMFWPEKGSLLNPILIQDDILYYISWSIRAWNLKTKDEVFKHTFDYPLPESQWYGGASSLQAEYYRGKILYISGENYTSPDGFRNIHCIDAKTGKQVWSDIAKGSFYHETNPIIVHDRLYVPQSIGLWVYQPETGKLLGVDKSFKGSDVGRNVLYKDYIIYVVQDKDSDDDDGKLVAVYVGE
jgi:outer membrane protein assembly factor BamB